MVALDEIKGSSINKKANSTMSVMLCTGVTFVKKISCLVARIVSFDTCRSASAYFPYFRDIPIQRYCT